MAVGVFLGIFFRNPHKVSAQLDGSRLAPSLCFAAEISLLDLAFMAESLKPPFTFLGSEWHVSPTIQVPDMKDVEPSICHSCFKKKRVNFVISDLR